MLSQKLISLLIFVILNSNCNAGPDSNEMQTQTNCPFGQYNKSNFGMKLFQKIAQETPSNVIISPVGQEILLAMIMEGAVNETEGEIKTALQISENAYRRPLNNSTSVKIANRIFLDKEHQIKEDYRKKLQQGYSADVQSVEKEKPKETAETINQWVKNETSGLIPSIVEESDITNDLLMVLGNTIYFKAIWNAEFEETNTKKDCFYKNGKDDCVMQEMMAMNDENFKYSYFEELDADIVDIPYIDGHHSMMIVLPKQRNGIDQMVAKLHEYSIYDFSEKLLQSPLNGIDLKIPKFTAEYESNMVKTLISLNITRIFNPGAQLDKMISSGRPIYVSKILHKSKIIVNEFGSEAAAVSIGKITFYSMNSGKKIPFIADHPFIYFIKDEQNNVLFLGKYTGP